jgi:hypothetical protein
VTLLVLEHVPTATGRGLLVELVPTVPTGTLLVLENVPTATGGSLLVELVAATRALLVLENVARRSCHLVHSCHSDR